MIKALYRLHMVNLQLVFFQLLVTGAALAIASAVGLWSTVVVFAILPIMLRERANLMEAMLPVSVRTLFIVRLLAFAPYVLLSLGLYLLATLVRHETPNYAQMLDVLAMVSIGLMLPHVIRPRTLAVSRPYSTLALVSLVAAVIAMYRWSSPRALTWTLVLMVPVVFVVAWALLPRSYILAGNIAHAFDRAVINREATAARHTGRASARWWLPVARSMFPPMFLFYVGAIIAAGFIGQWMFMLFILVSSVGQTLRTRLGWTATLPLSTNGRLMLLVYPTVVAFTTLFAVTETISRRMFPAELEQDGPRIERSDTDRVEDLTNVPVIFWRRSAEPVPAVRAPWGESTPPKAVHIMGRTFINPYTTRKSNSDRFDAWQFERATQAVYGQAISKARADSVGFRYPPRRVDRWNVRMLRWGTLATLALLLLSQGLTRAEPPIEKTMAQQVWAFVLGLAVFIPTVVILISAIYQGRGARLETVADLLFLRIADVLPNGIIAPLLLMSLSTWSAFRFLARRFRRSEWALPAIHYSLDRRTRV